MRKNQPILTSFHRFMTRTEELQPIIGEVIESKNISIKFVTDKNGYTHIEYI